MTKPPHPFQIARMERLRDLLVVNSASNTITAEVTPASVPNADQREDRANPGSENDPARHR